MEITTHNLKTVELFDAFSPERGYVIAETACGHGGDPRKLKQLIDCVSDSKCKIIKFQIFTTRERAVKGHKEWDIFNRLVLNEQEWATQIEYAKGLGLYVFVDVYGYDSLSIANKIGVDGYKIHSEDLLNTNFILDVCRYNKIVMIGIGAARRREISQLMQAINDTIPHSKIILMTGVQAFPTPLEAHSIREVTDLIEKYSQYGVKIGFSDHVEGNREEASILPLMALSAGAAIIEKHITLDRNGGGPDDSFSLESEELTQLCIGVKTAWESLGKVDYGQKSSEQNNVKFRRSLYFVNDIQIDEIITKDHVKSIRPGYGLPPKYLDKIIGKKSKYAIARGSAVTDELVGVNYKVERKDDA